jgi:hypothetical protein
MRFRSIAFCLGVAMMPGLAAAAQAQYDVIALQNVGGQGFNHPIAINNSGWSVGEGGFAPGFSEFSAVACPVCLSSPVPEPRG